VPWQTARLRLVIVPLMMGLHLGFAACMNLGYFPFIMMLAWVPFFPSYGWDWLTRSKRAESGGHSSSWAAQGLAVVLLIAAVWTNLSTLPNAKPLPQLVQSVVQLVRLDQHWALFAPAPLTDDGWLVIEAETYSGQKLDLLRPERPFSLSKPEHLAASFWDWKWQKLHAVLHFPGFQHTARRLGDLMADDYSLPQQAPQRVRSWRMYWVREETLPFYQAYTPQPLLITENAKFSVSD
jgi:hypothetical protein